MEKSNKLVIKLEKENRKRLLVPFQRIINLCLITTFQRYSLHLVINSYPNDLIAHSHFDSKPWYEITCKIFNTTSVIIIVRPLKYKYAWANTKPNIPSTFSITRRTSNLHFLSSSKSLGSFYLPYVTCIHASKPREIYLRVSIFQFKRKPIFATRKQKWSNYSILPPDGIPPFVKLNLTFHRRNWKTCTKLDSRFLRVSFSAAVHFLEGQSRDFNGKSCGWHCEKKKKETKEKRKEKENIGKWRNRATISRLTFSEFK